MQSKLFAIALIAAFAFAISSCSKDETPATCSDGIQNQGETGVDCGGPCAACPVNGKVKTQTNEGVTATYTYDAQGRVVFAQASNGYKNIFSYTSDSVTVFAYDSGATIPSNTSIFKLNTQGLATSRNDGVTYIYDSEGFLLVEMNASIGLLVTYEYSNGNLVKATVPVGSPPFTQSDTITYTYLTDKTEYRDYGILFFGKWSMNLVSTETHSSTGNTNTYTYEYDSPGRVTKQTVTYSGGGAPDGTTYTYE